MHEQIQPLIKLQAVELERARLAAELKKLPAEAAAAEAALKAAEKQAAEAAAALDREEKLRARLETEIATHRQKASRFRAQLDAVKTPAQAAAVEHEVAFSTAEADRLENEEFESLERTEAQESALKTAQARIAETTANLATIRQSVARRQEEFEAALAALGQERARLRPLIEEATLLRFDRMAAARGTGLARAENLQCSGCRMGIRLQVWNQLREGQLLHCDSCGRLLYFDSTLAPTPEELRPDLAPGAGQSLRRPKQS